MQNLIKKLLGCLTLPFHIFRDRRRDTELGNLLADFIHLMNKYGPDSPEVRNFEMAHKDNKRLMELTETTRLVSGMLEKGELD